MVNLMRFDVRLIGTLFIKLTPFRDLKQVEKIQIFDFI